MFEHTTEAEARKQILDLVADYCDTFHKKKEYKECIKTVKKSIKSGDIATAKKSLKDAQDIISDFEKLIKSYDSEHQNDSFSQALLSSWYATVAQIGTFTVEALKWVGISKAAGIIFPGSNIAKCALVI